MNFSRTLRAICFTLAGLAAPLQAESVHTVTDLSHEFSFYADGRFPRQYLPGEKSTSNWGNLYQMDASNVNFIVLMGCDSRVEYSEKDVDFLQAFMQEGGCVLIATDKNNRGQNQLAQRFGGFFKFDAKPPYSMTKAVPTEGEITTKGQMSSILFAQGAGWKMLVQDSEGRGVLASRQIGKGQLILGARGLFGNNPDGKDNINAEWMTPILKAATAGKKVDPNKGLPKTGATIMGNSKEISGVTFYYPDSLAQYFNCMVEINAKCQPLIEARMGVPLSEGMGGSIGLLATGGGGFSSGAFVGLAVFWENFPEVQHGMYEFLTHEFVHSWVLPHPEVWNEPIATYVGDLVMIDGGFKEEGEKRIAQNIQRAKRLDSTMKLYDLEGNSTVAGAPELNDGQKNDIHWGKSFWVFEEMAKQDKDFVAKYYQAKRKFVPAKLEQRFNMHDTVAVISIALGKDMYPWFNEHGMPCNGDKAQIDWKSQIK